MTLQLKKHFLLMAAIIMMIATFPFRYAHSDMFGGDVVVLSQILIQSVDEVYKLQQIIGNAQQTVSILEDMNRGVKEVLQLSKTAHVPLPPGVFAQAKGIDQAVYEAHMLYGDMGDRTPLSTRTHYQSGAEALSLSQDAFDYSTFLDDQGERVKSSAVLADQSSATRLTAETMGVLLHSMNQSNRLQAKQLELTSSDRIETSAKEGVRFDSFVNTHQHIEDTFQDASISSLNEIPF